MTRINLGLTTVLERDDLVFLPISTPDVGTQEPILLVLSTPEVLNLDEDPSRHDPVKVSSDV